MTPSSLAVPSSAEHVARRANADAVLAAKRMGSKTGRTQQPSSRYGSRFIGPPSHLEIGGEIGDDVVEIDVHELVRRVADLDDRDPLNARNSGSSS